MIRRENISGWGNSQPSNPAITCHPCCRIHLRGTPRIRGESHVIPLNYFVPYYINEQQSDVRGIKCGWYTLDECGKLGSGPFSRPDECLGTAPAPNNGPMSMWSH